MGFNCPKDEDTSFLFDVEALGIDCGKYDTSDCSDEDDEDLFITQVEQSVNDVLAHLAQVKFFCLWEVAIDDTNSPFVE